jgi:hypothetical protein
MRSRLFAAIPNEQSSEVKQKKGEIAKASFQELLPKKASASANYFWLARRGFIKKAPKIRASTHQFPPNLPKRRLRLAQLRSTRRESLA